MYKSYFKALAGLQTQCRVTIIHGMAPPPPPELTCLVRAFVIVIKQIG